MDVFIHVLPTHCSCAKFGRLLLVFKSVLREFLAVWGPLWSRRKIYSNACTISNICPAQMDSHFINIARNRTGPKRLTWIKSATPIGEDPEEIRPVGPVESVMMEACKNVIFPEIHHCHFASFSIQRRPSPARK